MYTVEEFVSSLSEEQREVIRALNILRQVSDAELDDVSCLAENVCRTKYEWKVLSKLIVNEFLECEHGRLILTNKGDKFRLNVFLAAADEDGDCVI